MTGNSQAIITGLTLLVSVAWLISFVIRIWHPWDGSTVADTAMLLVLGFWFGTKALKKEPSNDDTD